MRAGTMRRLSTNKLFYEGVEIIGEIPIETQKDEINDNDSSFMGSTPKGFKGSKIKSKNNQLNVFTLEKLQKPKMRKKSIEEDLNDSNVAIKYMTDKQKQSYFLRKKIREVRAISHFFTIFFR
jgi:hypothetical protein